MPARRLKKTPAHLEITAFINLIVVLVPFLLSVAVFTHLSVIDLALPAQSNEKIQNLDPNKPLKLEVILRSKYVEVNDKHGGRMASEGHRALLGMGVERRWRGCRALCVRVSCASSCVRRVRPMRSMRSSPATPIRTPPNENAA